ncbi:ABC transporter permease [Aeromicrobium phragmitis]|uniref:ABC transporter permease n=1 Tax=Aeromicrobium phragmitis TaxID=2478914 RepID=A0A3L8PN90_9ACTN|nr:ABC transporter permease [Aeromicrobium phragmitis]RLV56855.1 ABC transporter permease [Aeromicrobium phragmitis]
MPDMTPLPGQTIYVAPTDGTPLEETGTVDTSAPPEGQWKEAWKQLRSNWIFWVSAVLLVIIFIVVLFPGLFTDINPRQAQLSRSLEGPSADHWFGFDRQGYDVFSRVVYGARASVTVGILTMLFVTVVGLLTGAVAGFYGKWVDTAISRVADIFFAIPLILGAIVLLSTLNNVWSNRGYWGGVLAVVLVLAVFGWPQMTRIARGAVLEIKSLEFIDAARAIGATKRSNLWRHVIPNSLAPVIVTATVSLGVYIVAEATLSFLGIGLPPSVVSWGNDIAAAQSQVRSGNNLHVLFFPAGALAITVLSFMLLGDAVRDALDPKAKKS